MDKIKTARKIGYTIGVILAYCIIALELAACIFGSYLIIIGNIVGYPIAGLSIILSLWLYDYCKE